MAEELDSTFAFTAEQQALRAAVSKFCESNFGEQAARRVWKQTSATTRRCGGGWAPSWASWGCRSRNTMAAWAVRWWTRRWRSSSSGATLASGPLFGTVYLAIPALAACPAGTARDDLLVALIEGASTAASAVADRGGAFDPAAVTVHTDGDVSATTLTGTFVRVVDADAADELLVAATGSDGIGLYAVHADAPGVQRTPLVTMDLTRPQATVTLTGAPGRLLAGPDSAERVITHALQVGAALLAVEQVGAAQHPLDLSVTMPSRGCSSAARSSLAVKHKLAEEACRPRACPLGGLLRGVGARRRLRRRGTGYQRRAGDGIGGSQQDRRRHHSGARRYRLHLGASGAPVLQTRRDRRRSAGQRRTAPQPGRRTGAGHRCSAKRCGPGGHRLTIRDDLTAGSRRWPGGSAVR